MSTHIVQSPGWGEFKSTYGTKAVNAGGVQYTLHKVPFTNYFYGYAPKTDPLKINFELLAASLKENNCIVCNFDVPNVIKNTSLEKNVLEIFKNGGCVKSPRDQFAKFNILLDITKSEEDLLESMHYKHRYNIKLAQKKGVYVTRGASEKDFETFFTLFKETADRQKYYIHSKKYYETILKILGGKNMVEILTAYSQNEPLTSWMLFVYDGTLYYPYGGSSEKFKNLQASTLIGWEAIKYGKKHGCKTFDMWGASGDINDEKDPWYGFTNFKLRFGGQYFEYMDSYDFVVNKQMYYLFNLANNLRWKMLHLLK